MKNNVKKLNIRVGDVVLADLTELHRDKKEIGEVIKIQKRFGTNRNGERAVPLLTLRPSPETVIDTHWRCVDGIYQRSLSAGWVAEIIKRGNLPVVKHNRFKVKDQRNFCKTSKKGVLCGPMGEILNTFMSQLDEEISTSINFARAKALYMKNPMGLISVNRGFLTVRAKYFERWFRKNWQKCLNTFAEMDAIENEYDRQIEASWHKTFEADFIADFRRESEAIYGGQ